ncbi:MAG: VWA domain-containing protein [Gemmatimonadales bacterium]
MSERDLTVHLVRFARALRERGVPVSVTDEIDAAQALGMVDVSDPVEVRCALRTALKIHGRHRRLFAELFDEWFGLSVARRRDAEHEHPTRERLSDGRVDHPELQPARAESDDRGSPRGETPGYSSRLLLRRKPFDQCDARDLREMEKLLARLAVKLATRKSRRWTPMLKGTQVDLRHSLRRSLAADAELLSLGWRDRAVEIPRIVLLCDTSGSMDPHTRFLLTFVLSLSRVVRKTEVFAFNTSLTRLTRWLVPGRIATTLDRLAVGVPDWSGGTRIGESLATFVELHYTQLVDGRTDVVILSDGLDRGDPEQLARAMAAIRRRARKVIWLNPLLGDGRYEPTARGMAAALPFVHHFEPAHNLESLERLIPLLAA